MPPVLTLTEARDQGFNHVVGVFEQARIGWLSGNIEESRSLWALAHRIQSEAPDRPLPERARTRDHAAGHAGGHPSHIPDLGRLPAQAHT